MAILNFVSEDEILQNHKDFFEHKNNIVFDECIAMGKISRQLFQTKEAIESRISEIDKIYNISCRDKYLKFIQELTTYNYANISQVVLYFSDNMFSQINLMALIYYLADLKQKEILNADITIHILDTTIKGSIDDMTKVSRYLSNQDVNDVNMTFLNLINSQNEKYKEELVERVCQRIESFPLMKRAIYNYFYIRTKTFKNKCKRNENESEEDYVSRMIKIHHFLGLNHSYYLSLVHKTYIIH